MALVSIIVPIYNLEKYVRRCVESILSQTHKNIEVILVDDGSTDNSGKICDEYAQIDSRVKVIHKENGGVCSARNVGLANTGGGYLLFVDGDDAIHPKLIESALKLLLKTHLDCIVYGYELIQEEIFHSFDPCTLVDMGKLEILSREDALKTILVGEKFRMLVCNKLYKTELWKDIRFPEGRKYGDDTSVTYKVLDVCERVGYISSKYYYYCMREGSALHSKITNDNLQLFDAYNELIDYMHQHHEKIVDFAYYAYAVRIFDFFAAIKKCTDLTNDERICILQQLRCKTKCHFKDILRLKSVTYNQKVLLIVFRCSKNLFWKLYAMF